MMWQEISNRTLVGPILSTDALVNIHGWMDAHDIAKWRLTFTTEAVGNVRQWAGKMWQRIS